jgi:hypothetical protein
MIDVALLRDGATIMRQALKQVEVGACLREPHKPDAGDALI